MISSNEFEDLLDIPDRADRRLGRDRFLDALTADTQIALAQSEKLAILLVDLRKFLGVNLSYGYESGDEVLLLVPGILRAAIKKASIIERLGDNCFGIVIPAIPSPALLPIAAEKIRQKLSEPMQVGEHRIALGCHLASVVFPDDGLGSEDLLLAAERYLVDAKSRIYCDIAIPTLNQSVGRERWKIETHLQEAVDGGELELFYQPKIDLHSRLPTCAEALMRWNSKEFGFVPPDSFISVAEESSLINRITDWAIKTAARERSDLLNHGGELSIAVNVSASDVYDRNLIIGLESVLGIWGLDPEQLTLEITESVIMDNPDLALKHLALIRDLGIKISMDDFGTGYSSLAYFKTLPVDEIKIDKSFVLNMREESDDAVLVETIITLAHKFNLTVVAEGVENLATLKQLIAMGCDYAQGYYFSPPLPLEKFANWFAHYDADAYWHPTS